VFVGCGGQRAHCPAGDAWDSDCPEHLSDSCLVQENPELFKMYHEGFRVQAQSWQKNPVHLAKRWLQSKPPGWTVADFGCGDAELARDLSDTHRIHSFDLYAHNDRVTACNMASVPCDHGAATAVASFLCNRICAM
jgi:hypothetical protein